MSQILKLRVKFFYINETEGVALIDNKIVKNKINCLTIYKGV